VKTAGWLQMIKRSIVASDITAPFSFVPRIAVKIDFLPTSHFAHQHFQEKLYGNSEKSPQLYFQLNASCFE
jgi:hypothetical protein